MPEEGEQEETKKIKCPKCESEKVCSQEDEDSYWLECQDCGYTFGYSIKPGFG